MIAGGYGSSLFCFCSCDSRGQSVKAWEGLLTADSGEVMDRLSIDLRALLDREELLERESLADRRFAVKEEVGADFCRWLKRWKHKNDLEANIPLWAKQAGLEMGSNLKYRLWSVKERAGEDQLILQIRPYAIQGVELRVSTGSSGIWKDACKMWDGFYESSVVLTELGTWVVQEKEKRSVWELSC